jgi:CRISP-associated protein Cas1
VIKRTLEISREPAHLAVRNDQLLLKRDGQTIASVPCEDIGVVLVDHPQTTYTHGALAKLAESDAAVVICGRDHLPAAILLPMVDHSQVVWRLDAQLRISRPLRKNLWKQIVVAKIGAQANILAEELSAKRKLRALAREVRSGDPTNVEAQAARVYWANWLATSDVKNLDTEAFRRDPQAAGVNSFLNYGYAVLRAAIARAIVAAGLLPSLGLHHRNRSNPFCLADDLIEPLRPLVDDRVRELFRQGYDELNQPAKAALLELLTERVSVGGGEENLGPLMVQLHRYVASLVHCYSGETRELQIPVTLPIPVAGEGPGEGQSPEP